MKNALRIDEIEGFLRDGGSVEEILIEPEPSDKRRVWSKAGKEIEQDKERSHAMRWVRENGRWCRAYY